MLIYLSGKMRGEPELNYPLFNDVAASLRRLGHKVFNPTREMAKPPHILETDSKYMEDDLQKVCLADAIAVIPGWQTSHLAPLEIAVAFALGKPILDAYILEPLDESIIADYLAQYFKDLAGTEDNSYLTQNIRNA